MENITENITWTDFKENLKKHHEWLGAFDRSAVDEAISRINSKSMNHYEPLLINTLLKEGSEALDRCLTLQKESYVLEIAAVEAAASYKLFKDLTEIDEELETNALSLKRLEKEKCGYSKASSMYTSDKGFSEHDRTLSESSQEDISAAIERQKLLKRRWAIREEYEAVFDSYHNEPQNPFNFKWREERIVNLMEDDLLEAYEKLKAAYIGIKTVYNVDMPLPELINDQSLDDLVMWTRNVIRFLDIEAQQEVSYDLVIPLTQEWRPSGEPLINKDEFQRAIDQPGHVVNFEFELSDVFFNHERVRLRGVGLAFGTRVYKNQTTTLETWGYWRLRATINTPKQPDVMQPSIYYNRPPVVLGNVAPFGRMMGVAMSTGPETYNLDPRGKWKIAINKLSVFSDEKTANINEGFFSNVLKDLKLYLQVVVKPLPNINTVFAPD